MLMNADGLDIEMNIDAEEEYYASLTEIYVRTGVNGFIPEEETEAAEIILEAHRQCEANGVNVSALKMMSELVDRMPNDDKIYDLQKVADEYVASAATQKTGRSSDPTISKKGSKTGAGSFVRPPDMTVTAIVASPDFGKDHTVFTVAFRAGHPILLKSIDGGYKWRKLDTPKSARNSAIDVLVLSPNYAKDQTLFMSVPYVNGHPEGLILKSEDGGQTWKTIRDLSPADGFLGANGIAVSPDFERDETLFVAERRLYKSPDGGHSWRPVNTSGTIKSSIESIAISPNYANDKTIFIGSGFPGRTYRSIDGGASWSEVHKMKPSEHHVNLVISPEFTKDRTVYSMYLSDKGIPGGYFRSIDAGKTWQELEERQPWRPLVFSPGYGEDKMIFAMVSFWPEQKETELRKSTDRGMTWTQVRLPRSPDISGPLAFTIDKTLFVARGDWGTPSSGVYVSNDDGKNWAFWKWAKDEARN